MDKEEFELEALCLYAIESARTRCAKVGTGLTIHEQTIVAFANAIRDMILKDLAENNPPVAWMYEHDGMMPSAEHPIFSARKWSSAEEPWTETPLYAKPPIQQAPEGWQLALKHPTTEMSYAGHLAYENKAIDMASPTPTEFPEGGASEACYYAMLAAAPEYKE